MRNLGLVALLSVLLSGPTLAISQSPEPGLLFYLSGDKSFRADYAAGGDANPNFLKDVTIQPGGSKGGYLQCGDNQLLSYLAPGNIYARRGTLAFDWRSREPVDQTEFPIFRVGYGDHSSWDMTWLRIDYNGHGFDAFVTDVNLGRTRVSYTMRDFPKPDQWVHLALAWDETRGIRFYVNGQLVGEKAATGQFDAALDQFGPHSRIIAPSGVESSYNYDRGGDLDELRIYDRMLSDENIAGLATHVIPQDIPQLPAEAAARSSREDWLHRFGWNLPNQHPEPLPDTFTAVRKVQINDAYDLKRWWWKGTDGIPETTWPGVYNRSRLVGRFDYFQLPDWDCYALSGKSVTFYLPDEPWNHLELEGGAWGKLALLTPGEGKAGAVADPDQHDPSPMLVKPLFDRPEGQERSTFDLKEPVRGEKVRFTNAVQEWPIQEFTAYYVHSGKEPAGVATLRYTFGGRSGKDNPSVQPIMEYIHNRFPEGERATLIAAPATSLIGGTGANSASRPAAARRGSGSSAEPQDSRSTQAGDLPIVHLVVPADYRGVQADEGHGSTYGWENLHAGLDGIAIDLPSLNLKPTHGQYIPMNIQVLDPVWPMRRMFDFSFSVKPGQPHTLWLDTRDRMLPNGKSIYLTIASASPEFGARSLEGMNIRLIFKPWDDAKPEHVADRLTQVRDNYANMVEESVSSRKLNLFNRFDADATELLRVDPDNLLGRRYWSEMNHEQPKPPYTPPAIPAGVPAWAYLQTRDLSELRSLINWYVDHRQISDGEFGGGLSDDSDFLNWWPGLAFMGADPDKLRVSLNRTLEAIYANGMFTNGLATAQYDELHSYEDGLNVLGQAMMLNFGSPKQIERAMVTAKRLEWLTGVNSAGQRQIRSSYYSGTKMAENGVWGWAKARSYFVFHPALELVLFNGTPETRKLVIEVADGFLAHRHPDPNGRIAMHYTVNFHTNQDLPGSNDPWFILWAAYKWTGDSKYIVPFSDAPAASLRQINADALDVLKVRDTWGKELLNTSAPAQRSDSGIATETNLHLDWQLTGDTHYLDQLYNLQIETAVNREFINREGSLWIDRIYFNNGELQRGRLGGVALQRGSVYPGNVVSWKFGSAGNSPDEAQKVAILVPEGAPDHIRVLAYNLEDHPVAARMTGWEIDPGMWEITQATQSAENAPLAGSSTRTEAFERSKDLAITFAPHTTTVLELKLKQKGVPYWSRPDLGIDPEDVKVSGRTVAVTVHSVGAVDSPGGKVTLKDRAGKVLASVTIPALKAPTDLQPKTALVTLTLPSGSTAAGAIVSVQCNGTVPEITQMNNDVTIGEDRGTLSPAAILSLEQRK